MLFDGLKIPIYGGKCTIIMILKMTIKPAIKTNKMTRLVINYNKNIGMYITDTCKKQTNAAPNTGVRTWQAFGTRR